jgi:hypothetical protein
MEAMLRISLYSYPYLELAKTLYLIIAMSSLQQNCRRGQNRFCQEMGSGQGGEMAQTIYPHMNK